jgi:hypothetical protein
MNFVLTGRVIAGVSGPTCDLRYEANSERAVPAWKNEPKRQDGLCDADEDHRPGFQSDM